VLLTRFAHANPLWDTRFNGTVPQHWLADGTDQTQGGLKTDMSRSQMETRPNKKTVTILSFFRTGQDYI